MHQFLSAIGFSKLNRESLAELIEEVIERPDYQESAIDIDGTQFVELRYMVADNVGLVLRGQYNEDDEFMLDYYYPSYFGSVDSSNGDIEIIKQTDKDNYYVMCDEVRLGVNLIFQLQNMGDFLRSSFDKNKGETSAIKLAGLSTDAKILLPVYNNEKSRLKAKSTADKRLNLVNQAREGNEEAMEQLTMDEIDLYSKISRRIMREDLFTVVSSYFMPFGIENDKYDILGEIIDIKTAVNHITMEEIYIFLISCNDINLEVCINKNNLLGEPAIGRRFKGNIWLQGTVDFY